LRSGAVGEENPIVVIDDPVSSLDQDFLFGASAMIWGELVSPAFAGQLFLFTHNFELFRQWERQLATASRVNKREVSYSAYVLRTANTTSRRVPQLEHWHADKHKSARLGSVYNHLFSTVAKSVVTDAPTLAQQMDQLALIPNAARRMLESFFAFKYPGLLGQFHEALKEALDQAAIDDPAVRNRIERWAHTYSHDESGDFAAPVLHHSEASAVLASIFALMHALDPGHVQLMCDALGVDAQVLVGRAGGSAG
jgi:wobble nucleotide-excising tRNase